MQIGRKFMHLSHKNLRHSLRRNVPIISSGMGGCRRPRVNCLTQVHLENCQRSGHITDCVVSWFMEVMSAFQMLSVLEEQSEISNLLCE